MPSFMMAAILKMTKESIAEKLGEVKLRRAERKLKFYAPSMVDAYKKIAKVIDRIMNKGYTDEATI
jgi:hypothetical protein